MDSVPREHYASLEQLAPGDRIWLDGAWREVVASKELDGEISVFTESSHFRHTLDFTAPAALLVRRAER